MAGTATVGVLRVLMSADSAQITSDLGKARKAVADTRADFALFGRSGKDAKQVFVDISSASGRMKDAKEITQLLGRAIGGLSGEAAKATHFLSELATEGLTGYTLAAGAAAAAVGFAVSTISQAWKDAKGAAEDATKAAVHAIAKVREYGAERFDALRGTHLAPVAAAEQRVTEAVDARARAYREMQEAGFGIVGATRAYLKAEEDVNEAYRERVRVVDRLMVAQTMAARDLDAAMRGIAGDRERDTLLARLPEDARKAEREIATLGKTLADLSSRVGLSEEDARAAVQAGLLDYETARNLTRERADAERKAASFLREQADAIRRRVAFDSLASLEAEAKAMEKELEFKELGVEADRKDFEIRERMRTIEAGAHRFDLENENSLVSRKIALLTRMLHLNGQVRQIEEAPGKAAEAERLRTLEGEAAEAGRAAEEARQRTRDRDLDALSDALGARLEFENRYYETMADLSRSETEREVREVDGRYAELLDEARAYGLETVELERWIEGEKGRIRAEGAERERERARDERAKSLQAAVTGEDLGEGFRARVSQLREETAGWGRLGAEMADLATQGLSQGVARALEDVARGTKSAKDAFRDWAREFAFDVARMIQQALILKAILALFPGLSAGGAGAGAGGATPAPATAAHGGTWRVGGFGGLDSKLVALRVSPGELVKVTDGANSRGGGRGDVHVSLVTRPVVVAEEMAARMSREAKAGLVASALHRGSRRGARAVE